MIKKITLIACAILILTAGYSFAQMNHEEMMGSGMMGSQGQQQAAPGGSYRCPMGSGMMGQGMMGYGMGRGMMGHGGYGMMGQGMMGHGGCGMMGQGMMGYGMGHGMMGQGGCGMMGQGGMGYKAEEYKKYLDDTAKLRRELHNKKFEYFEALRRPKTTQEDLSNMMKEMEGIQKEINGKWKK